VLKMILEQCSSSWVRATQKKPAKGERDEDSKILKVCLFKIVNIQDDPENLLKNVNEELLFS